MKILISTAFAVAIQRMPREPELVQFVQHRLNTLVTAMMEAPATIQRHLMTIIMLVCRRAAEHQTVIHTRCALTPLNQLTWPMCPSSGGHHRCANIETFDGNPRSW